jgi:hypothetical protein
LIFSTRMERICPQNTPKDFPEEWLPEKAKSPSKKKGTKTPSNTYVFTTSDMTARHSKFMNLKDWETVSIGDKFWLKSGAHMIVVEKETVDKKRWSNLFKEGGKSYKKCASVFLGLSDEDKTGFSRLSAKEQISFLNVPVKAQKSFKDDRWGKPNLFEDVYYSLIRRCLLLINNDSFSLSNDSKMSTTH